MNIFQKFFASLRLREAVRIADRAFALSRKRHYVLPGAGRKLIVLDRKNFRILKRKGYIPAAAAARDALVESFYFTPQGDGSGVISRAQRRLKAAQFLDWYAEASRK